MVIVIQLAIVSGSTSGGRLFDAREYQSTLIASAIVPLLAAFLSARAQWTQPA